MICQVAWNRVTLAGLVTYDRQYSSAEAVWSQLDGTNRTPLQKQKKLNQRGPGQWRGWKKYLSKKKKRTSNWNSRSLNYFQIDKFIRHSSRLEYASSGDRKEKKKQKSKVYIDNEAKKI